MEARAEQRACEVERPSPGVEKMNVSAETPLVAPGADQKRVTARRISGNYLAALRHCERSEAIQPSGQVAALPAQLRLPCNRGVRLAAPRALGFPSPISATAGHSCTYPGASMSEPPRPARRLDCFALLAIDGRLSPDRRRVLDAAQVPQLVEPAGNSELGFRADVAFVDFSVIADRTDGIGRPIGRKAHLRAEIPVEAH